MTSGTWSTRVVMSIILKLGETLTEISRLSPSISITSPTINSYLISYRAKAMRSEFAHQSLNLRFVLPEPDAEQSTTDKHLTADYQLTAIELVHSDQSAPFWCRLVLKFGLSGRCLSNQSFVVCFQIKFLQHFGL